MIDRVAEQSPLGGLERWIHDPTIDEVLVNGGSDIWVERSGRLEFVGRMRPATLLAAIEQILAPTGRRLDRTHPTVDARLPDGARVCAAIEPVAVDGPCLAVRRFAPRPVPLAEFADPPVAELLGQVVRARCNLMVSGATSAGKTTMLNALAREAEPGARFVTLEDVAELNLTQSHVVRLETRDATPDGVGEITLAHLLRTALRLRPDRLVVGEIRGAEAVHLLQALNTGHDGSMATVHANSATDALARLASLVLHEAANWPLDAVHEHVSRAVDVVVHVARGVAGVRHVHQVAEVCSAEPGRGLAVRVLAEGDRVLAPLTRART